MRQGGNKKCRKYLQKHGLDLKSCSIKERYESPVAHKYHQKLKKQIKAIAEKHPAASNNNSSNLETHSNHSRKSTGSNTSGKKSNTDLPLRRAGSAESPPRGETVSTPLRRANTAESPPGSRSTSSPVRRVDRTARSVSGLETSGHTSPASGLVGRGSSFRVSTPQVRASAPTIVYLGRSFLANNLAGYSNRNDEETLRINDHELEVPRKLEQLWYNGDEDGTHLQSYASTSLSSTSLSLSSYFGGGGNNNYHTELSIKDLHALEKDGDVKDYVRQQLLRQWNRTQQGNK